MIRWSPAVHGRRMIAVVGLLVATACGPSRSPQDPAVRAEALPAPVAVARAPPAPHRRTVCSGS